MQSDSHYNECIFCEDNNAQAISIMMTEALIAKHAVNQTQTMVGYVDVIMGLEEPCTQQQAWAANQYREWIVADQRDQFLKRQYKQQQFQGKINMLTEYYKFHADIPRVVEKGIEKILGKYYDKKRQCDYKKIKRQLKEEQGLSITSMQQSESSFNDSQIEKKSRYSTLLDDLQESKIGIDDGMSDSKLLKEMCKLIDKALPPSKDDLKNFNVKGQFSSKQKIFEQYLRQQQTRIKQKLRERQRQREKLTQKRVGKKLNLQQLLKKGREKVQLQNNAVQQSSSLKRKQKDSKFIYNTNIKIQIKNAMFYSSQAQPLQLGNIQYESGNKQDSRFRKKSLINQVNLLNQNLSSKKLLSDIYKSAQQVYKPRNMIGNISKQRVTTKESINKSQIKQKKKIPSNSKPASTTDLKKTLSGSQSARKIVYSGNTQWTRSISGSKPPIRSVSTTNIRKRSSSISGNGSSSLLKKADKIIEKRPIESISRYGSSDMRSNNNNSNNNNSSNINMQIHGKNQRSASIKDLLSRKLTITGI